ncbi:hypothetical protein GCM10010176_102270 [Nonomuraea spiralis]|nr:hypothetical protein GCM10010176_102270 [Nonomuraea spiralis]
MRWHRNLAARKWTFTDRRRPGRPCTRRDGPTGGQFLTAQAHAIIACDFLVVETVLLKRPYVLVFIEHGTRRLHLAGVSRHPTGAWTTQQARNLAMDLGDHFAGLRFVIHDRDPLLTSAFREVFQAEGLRNITAQPTTTCHPSTESPSSQARSTNTTTSPDRSSDHVTQ